MNRGLKDYALRRGGGIGGGSNSDDHHHLDLFSRTRRALSSSDDRTTALRLGKISAGSARSSRIGSDDLLASTDSGKNDYDWLLTPPATPLFASPEGNEFQQSFSTPRRSSAARSVSTTKSSRLSSTSRVESGGVSARPARSSSATRSSVSYSQNSNSHYSSIRSSSSVLNTSSASVSSYIRPSAPITRSSSSARPCTPTRTTPSRDSRPSTPSKARSAPILSSSIDKPRPSLGSRPSTPSSRPQISSRPSTPTRNNNSLASTMRTLSSNGRSTTSSSRPSSPNPSRVRSQHLAIPSDFPHDTPSNLRTTMPDRPVSAGRSRPAANATMTTARASAESQGGHNSFPRRASSPMPTRGRSVEPKGRSNSVHSNGYASEVQEPRRSSSRVSESPSRRNIRASSTTIAADSNAYGRTISKKPLENAMKHMEIRDGQGSMRPLTGNVLYPQSMRSTTSKIHSSLKNYASGDVNGRLSARTYKDSVQYPENVKYNPNGALENGRRREENDRLLFDRLSEVDMFESARYDAILLKEDLKNTNWLLGVDEKSDQGLIFDHGFESLPEPFGLS